MSTKSSLKSAKKTAKNEIESVLIKELNNVTAKFGPGSKKFKKSIEKSSKRLAKKLSKEIKIDESFFANESITDESKPNKDNAK
ncbi:hypothetical protein [Mucilaginibacter sp. PAMB04168]|uniref:hypothetical protein n=1 Tax=Mucilaginibacter sp. PAMB04168 TaxID=3138567 RepID=UPI0031F67219